MVCTQTVDLKNENITFKPIVEFLPRSFLWLIGEDGVGGTRSLVVALALQTGWQIKYASTLQKGEEEGGKGGKTSGVHR